MRTIAKGTLALVAVAALAGCEIHYVEPNWGHAAGPAYGNGCMPDCSQSVCGDDGCGGSCGTCEYGSCEAGQCVGQFVCVPECGECGWDGCGGWCGGCGWGESCFGGTCWTTTETCVADCSAGCGDDGCGGWCGDCWDDVCVPDCSWGCGDDGCGGWCGDC